MPSFTRPLNDCEPGFAPPLPVNSTTVVNALVATLILKIVPCGLLAPPSRVVPQMNPASKSSGPSGPEPFAAPFMPVNSATVVKSPVVGLILKTVPRSPPPPSLEVPQKFPEPSRARPPTGELPFLAPPVPVSSATVVTAPLVVLILKTVPAPFAPPDCVTPQSDPAPSLSNSPLGLIPATPPTPNSATVESMELARSILKMVPLCAVGPVPVVPQRKFPSRTRPPRERPALAGKSMTVSITPVARLTLKTVPAALRPNFGVTPQRFPASSAASVPSGFAPVAGPSVPMKLTTVVNALVIELNSKTVPLSVAPPPEVVPR